MFKIIRFLVTHGIALGIGFALGVYLLPLLIAPQAPSDDTVSASTRDAVYHAEFRRDLPGSDFLHWGEGQVSIAAGKVGFTGSIAPGPDYYLYLTRELVQTEDEFLASKADAARIGPIKTFDNFLLDIPPGVDIADYGAVVVWCETFSEFITAASYR